MKFIIINHFCFIHLIKKGWIDEKLKWKPSAYDGIEFVHIPIEKIWLPDILLGFFFFH